MMNQLKNEVEAMMAEDGKMLAEFMGELANCMGPEDQIQFTHFMNSMLARRQERVENISSKLDYLSADVRDVAV